MIEEGRKGLRGYPEHESKYWLEKLVEIENKRDGYLELAAEGFMRREELRTKLAALEETRETAGRELQALQGRSELLRSLEREKDAIMKRYASMVPEALETLSPQERHRVYRMLRLRVVAHPDDTMEVQGVFGDQFLGTEDVLRIYVSLKTPSRPVYASVPC
jgi:cell division septum initiation protein DivIVA